MPELREATKTAVQEGRIGDRLWLYATYHCNLACRYCLTESSPGIAQRRTMTGDAMITAAREARDLGFGCIGITGGETLMAPGFIETLQAIASILPTIVLTNGTLFSDQVLNRLQPLGGLDVAFQISLDSDDADRNDEFRGPENFAKVVRSIPRLIERGIRVRVATTVEYQTTDELARLCVLHRSLGVPDEDHVVRSVVRRGRAAVENLGVELGPTDVLPELTLTAEGAFMHPFAPTVRDGRTDLDLLVSRETRPLDRAASRFLRLAAGLPSGDDVVRNIR